MALAAEKRPASSGLLAMATILGIRTSPGAFSTASGAAHAAKSVKAGALGATCSRWSELTAVRERTCHLPRHRQHPPLSSSRIQQNSFPHSDAQESARSRASLGKSGSSCPAFLVSRSAGLWIDAEGSPGWSFRGTSWCFLKAVPCADQRGTRLHS